ncbi:MAG TPA: hypothetical protein VKT81_10575 [Bryobacteraceae bacterium]|nr:hypothetical protein [Bryobacteraceae bacterium]
MRAKLSLDSSPDRRTAGKAAMPGVPLARMPLEWLDAGSWRLPSGKALAEFALQAGFLAPPLFDVKKVGEASRARVRRFMREGVQSSGVPSADVKQCGKGSHE